MPDLLNIHETADYLRLTPQALYSQRHRGELPGVLGLKVGRKLVYRISDIERFLDGQLEAQMTEFEAGPG